jgi:hypothetical protein
VKDWVALSQSEREMSNQRESLRQGHNLLTPLNSENARLGSDVPPESAYLVHPSDRFQTDDGYRSDSDVIASADSDALAITNELNRQTTSGETSLEIESERLRIAEMSVSGLVTRFISVFSAASQVFISNHHHNQNYRNIGFSNPNK